MFIHCRYMLSAGAHMCTRPRRTLSSCFMAWYDNYFVWFDVFTALLIKMTVFWIWHFVELGTVTEVAERFTASIFKMVMVLASYHSHWTCFSLSNTTKSSKQFILGWPWRLEADSSSEKLVTICRSMQCHIPEDCNHEYLFQFSMHMTVKHFSLGNLISVTVFLTFKLPRFLKVSELDPC
jgi:hypothetical protein